MPCYDPDEAKENHEARAKCDALTDMLCRVGRALTSDGFHHTRSGVKSLRRMPQDVLKWWACHAVEDAARGQPWE